MARLTPLWIQQGTFAAALDRRLIGALWPSGAVNGMAAVVQGGSMNLSIASGVAAVPDGVVIGGGFLCTADAGETVPIPQAPPAGTDRIDVVAVQPRDTTAGGAADDWIFNVIAGAPASSPAAPAVPAGQLAICEVTVRGGQASIAAGDLRDRRARGLAVPIDRPPFAPVHFRAVLAAQSIPRVVWTQITAWGATPTENIGGGQWSNGIYTIPAAGRYYISASALLAIPALTGWQAHQIQISPAAGVGPGAQQIMGWTNASGFNGSLGPVVMQRPFNAGDTIGMQIYNGHPTAAVSTFGGYVGMEIHRVE